MDYANLLTIMLITKNACGREVTKYIVNEIGGRESLNDVATVRYQAMYDECVKHLTAHGLKVPPLVKPSSRGRGVILERGAYYIV